MAMSLTATAGTVAQVTNVLPPAEAVATAPIAVPEIPVPQVPAPETSPVVAALPPLVVTPPVPPKKEQAPPPKVETPVVEPPKVVKVVPATPASIVKPAPRPAMAEIISAGPKAIDATAAFATALADAKASHAKLRDYSGHILLQERIKNELQPEQTAEVRVRIQPKAVAVKFIAPSSTIGRELIFADGRNGNKARAKAAGTYGPLAFANVAVSDSKAALTGRLTLADVGIAAMLDRIERALATEVKLRNPVIVTASDYTFAKKTVTRYEIEFERPHALRDAAKYVVCIDPETKLPVRLEVHDTSMREAISYVNLTFNQGIGDAPFER